MTPALDKLKKTTAARLAETTTMALLDATGHLGKAANAARLWALHPDHLDGVGAEREAIAREVNELLTRAYALAGRINS